MSFFDAIEWLLWEINGQMEWKKQRIARGMCACATHSKVGETGARINRVSPQHKFEHLRHSTKFDNIPWNVCACVFEAISLHLRNDWALVCRTTRRAARKDYQDNMCKQASH